MNVFKHCLQMEALCKELALREPHNKERWRVEARMWHRRAGECVMQTFGDVALPPEESETDQTVS